MAPPCRFPVTRLPWDLHSLGPAPPQIRWMHYVEGMHGFMTVLIGIMMFATFGVLVAGLFGLVRDGDPRRSNRLMQWRVVLQGATLLLFVIFMSLLRS